MTKLILAFLCLQVFTAAYAGELKVCGTDEDNNEILVYVSASEAASGNWSCTNRTKTQKINDFIQANGDWLGAGVGLSTFIVPIGADLAYESFQEHRAQFSPPQFDQSIKGRLYGIIRDAAGRPGGQSSESRVKSAAWKMEDEIKKIRKEFNSKSLISKSARSVDDQILKRYENIDYDRFASQAFDRLPIIGESANSELFGTLEYIQLDGYVSLSSRQQEFVNHVFKALVAQTEPDIRTILATSEKSSSQTPAVASKNTEAPKTTNVWEKSKIYRLSELSREEEATISKALAQTGSQVGENVSKGMTVLRAGGKILFWAGNALMIYDGIKGAIAEVQHPGDLANLVASTAPESERKYVAKFFSLVSYTGFIKGVYNGMAAPGDALHKAIAPQIFKGLVEDAPEGSVADRSQKSLIEKEVSRQLAEALKEGRRIYGASYTLPAYYVYDIQKSVGGLEYANSQLSQDRNLKCSEPGGESEKMAIADKQPDGSQRLFVWSLDTTAPESKVYNVKIYDDATDSSHLSRAYYFNANQKVTAVTNGKGAQVKNDNGDLLKRATQLSNYFFDICRDPKKFAAYETGQGNYELAEKSLQILNGMRLDCGRSTGQF